MLRMTSLGCILARLEPRILASKTCWAPRLPRHTCKSSIICAHPVPWVITDDSLEQTLGDPRFDNVMLAMAGSML
jgi:hypothetical protein